MALPRAHDGLEGSDSDTDEVLHASSRSRPFGSTLKRLGGALVVCGLAVAAWVALPTLGTASMTKSLSFLANTKRASDYVDSMRGDDVIQFRNSEDKSLYERLAGAYPIATVVDRFIDTIMVDRDLNANPLVKQAHHKVKPAGFKYLVWEIVNQATGGPAQYSGRDMKTAHWHLRITNAEWNKFALDFQDTLNYFHVPQKEQTDLVACVVPLKDQIVNESPEPVAAPPPPDANVDNQTLYKRLGGIYAIATVVDDFIDTIMSDPVLNANPKVQAAHHKVSPAGFKVLVTQFIASATGGPQVYTGKDMRTAHAGLGITSGEWNRFANLFGDTLDRFNVPEKTKNEVLQLVVPLQEQVVEL
jgi:hemoglobin|eukprot:TRINITY_DN735_c0_g1_i1.p1 TRINITY_DN735_c0_g1~~TRINITY_DN735_c0_g1_i1.p1  ORF type:complete len:359 (+),score=58.63 TRINITY_DN735_c0_g1_i1:67-1143(+)